MLWRQDINGTWTFNSLGLKNKQGEAAKRCWDVGGAKMRYCTKCVMLETNRGMKFDKDGVCTACRYYESKKK